MLEACDLDHRVVVRRRAGTAEHGRALYTDLLGDLLSMDDQRLTVRTGDATVHTVEWTDIAAAKRIPPRPVRYSEMAALERIADQAWPAPEHERLGDWFLRAAAGFTNRANSALPLGDPGRPLEAAIDACVEWYLARSLPPKITVALPLRRDVADALTTRGWYAQPRVLVQTASLTDVLSTPDLATPAERRDPESPAVRPDPESPAVRLGAGTVRLERTPSAGSLQLITARKTGLPEAAHRVLRGLGEVRFAEIREPREETPNGATSDTEGTTDPTTTIATARGAVVGEWMHLGLVEVVEAARRRGLARALTQVLASWALSAGATRALLQVEEHNTAAVGLYASMGFRTHHTYVTYRAPS